MGVLKWSTIESKPLLDKCPFWDIEKKDPQT
jgi:hypothetical protein